MPGKHSGFKMYGKSPMMKKLIGKQHNLPEELKAKILASDSPMEMYGKKHLQLKIKTLPSIRKKLKNLLLIS